MISIKHLFVLLWFCAMVFCGQVSSPEMQDSSIEMPDIIVAKLDNQGSPGFEEVKNAFSSGNPGYELVWLPGKRSIETEVQMRVLFVQKGGGTATLSSAEVSKVSVGDIILLRPDTRIETDSLIDYLSFTVPELAPDSLPTFIRPDWDPRITDTPGGCATETGAYRRILLTWLGKVGPYLFHSLNAHRVRIMDSFTHYHPVDGGFDEFYLVQMAMPGAKLITSTYTDDIENFSERSDFSPAGLLKVTPLKVGDLIYIPRGVIHRGVGGVLAQVITVPGFKPGAEIGVDYHLRRINEHFELTGKDSLPYNGDASTEVVIK